MTDTLSQITNAAVAFVFRGSKRKGAATMECDVAVWNVWEAATAAQRSDILAAYVSRHISVATKDVNGDIPADADAATVAAAEKLRLDACKAIVDVVNARNADAIRAEFFAPGKRAASGVGFSASPAEKRVIDETVANLSAAMESKGLVVASGKRGFVDADYTAAAAAHEKLKGLVKARGDAWVWAESKVLAYALDRDPEAVAAAQAKLDAFDL